LAHLIEFTFDFEETEGSAVDGLSSFTEFYKQNKAGLCPILSATSCKLPKQTPRKIDTCIHDMLGKFKSMAETIGWERKFYKQPDQAWLRSTFEEQ
jgi:hypothetical protein